MLRKSSCTRSTVDVASSRKRTMEQRIGSVKEKFAETRDDLEQLFTKIENHLNVNLNPLTHNQQYYVCLSNLDYLSCSLEQISMYCRTFEASFDSVTADLNETQSSLLISSPLNFPAIPPNFPTTPLNFPTSPPNFPTTPLNFPPSPPNLPTTPPNLPTTRSNFPTPPPNFPTPQSNFLTPPSTLSSSIIPNVESTRLTDGRWNLLSIDNILTPTPLAVKPAIPKKVKKKNNEKLIDFSSESSLSLDTVPERTTQLQQNTSLQLETAHSPKPQALQSAALLKHNTKVTTDISMAKKKIDQLEAKVARCKISEDDWSVIQLPEQPMLEQDKQYQALVAYHYSPSHFYVVVERFDEQRGFVLSRMTIEMGEYYSSHRVNVRPLLHDMHYCALLEKDEWYRCLIVGTKGDQVEVFFVDYGGKQWCDADAAQPLVPRFCEQSPFARECHLAHVEPAGGGQWSEEAIDAFKEICAGVLTMRVEDDSSESLGVVLATEDGLTLNDALVARGVAVSHAPPTQRPPVANAAYKDASSTSLPCSYRDTSSDSDAWDISNLVEHADLLVAVAGHAARDEADICKFYQGPPDSTCFKGAKCTKKHVVIHPDGWTRDKVQVVAPPPELSPPAPGSRARVFVAFCENYNHLYVHLLAPNENVPSELTRLIERMNTPAIRMSLERLQSLPAIGEMLIAYFSDKNLYRAQAIDLEPDVGRVRVRYVDFGNTSWVRLEHVFHLSAEFLREPFMAVSAVVAEIGLKRSGVAVMREALKVVRGAAGDKVFVANVIAHEPIGMVVELEDAEGFSLAQTLVTKHPDLFVFTPTKA